MVQQVTKGIKISVTTQYEGFLGHDHKTSYAFSYSITIENNSKDTVQLISRRWNIKDALNNEQVVTGQGVIGMKPVLAPGESHSYNSGCMLLAPVGAMNGAYTMINFNTMKAFKVQIPTFKLSAEFAMN
ncbi:Co2+/Mg2+ efflux protein ApaG [Aureitalea sp. L0-47]|jgi:ApaG protein|uniref:Co2+/Mg2+ efflux protein ApaG n=1 Tax=Aureitalea sp. L0-47 TaxID=2816962 RepID=UPI00223763AC|nr:Co2+/Mg2+ efflux protein ApaG [Aureitalea sp. L0-47]MCW5520126.1 Co2+/Mg2+ efflux protein ApaG [Aureitalea sp. L0-47]